jgi:hypothetical protein
MKRGLALFLSIFISAALVSWGAKGHKAIASIAQKHISAEVSARVSALLNSRTMPEIASWADEVKNEPEYKNTAPWHYLDLPSGLNYEQFKSAVLAQREPNVYSAIFKCEATLSNQADPEKQRREALMFLIHLVGDAHQPMHVSRAQDKGGNLIQVRFDGQGTNLHSVWDTRLIDHEGLSDHQIAEEYDTATDRQIKQWQAGDPMVWLWESYQISDRLYKEAQADNNFGNDYYNSHIGIVHRRIDQAGIRLAGVLNRIFSGNSNVKVSLQAPPQAGNPASGAHAELTEIGSMIGQTVWVQGKAYGYKELKNMTLIDLGASYPNQLLTLVLKDNTKGMFHALDIKGKTIRVEGTVSSYHGKPQIVLTDPSHLSVMPD